MRFSNAIVSFLFLAVLALPALASQNAISISLTPPLSGTDLVTDINNANDTLATNFSGTSAPGTPLTGQFWLDTTTSNLKIYDGSGFRIIGSYAGSNFTVPPGSGGTGLNAIGSASQCLKVNSGATALEFGSCASGSIGGSTGATDNALLRADGTGGSTLQNSPVTVADTTGMMTFATGGGVQTSTSSTNTVLLNVYDVNDTTYRTFITGTAGNTPTLAWTNPSGSTSTIDGVTIGGSTAAAGTFSSLTSNGTLAMGSNSITMTGSLAATGSRVTKGWFTDLESTNCPTIGGTSCSGSGGLARLTNAAFTTPDLGTPSAINLTNATSLPVAALPSNQKIRAIAFVIDGGGSTITTGVKGDLQIPFACTISRATLLADQSGSIVVNVWKDTVANYPPTVADKITASAPPTISSATNSTDATLTGWTTSITALDTLRFNVDSATSITRVTLVLSCNAT